MKLSKPKMKALAYAKRNHENDGWLAADKYNSEYSMHRGTGEALVKAGLLEKSADGLAFRITDYGRIVVK